MVLQPATLLSLAHKAHPQWQPLCVGKEKITFAHRIDLLMATPHNDGCRRNLLPSLAHNTNPQMATTRTQQVSWVGCTFWRFSLNMWNSVKIHHKMSKAQAQDWPTTCHKTMRTRLADLLCEMSCQLRWKVHRSAKVKNCFLAICFLL